MDWPIAGFYRGHTIWSSRKDLNHEGMKTEGLFV
jgi:hypothetical protein